MVLMEKILVSTVRQGPMWQVREFSGGLQRVFHFRLCAVGIQQKVLSRDWELWLRETTKSSFWWSNLKFPTVGAFMDSWPCSFRVSQSDSGSQGPVTHLTSSCRSPATFFLRLLSGPKKKTAGWPSLAHMKLSWFCSAQSGSLSPHPLHMQVCPPAKSLQSPWSHNSSLAPDLLPEELSHPDSLVTAQAS